MDQASIVGRAPLWKRLWIRIVGAFLMLLLATGCVVWWMQSGRVTATALFEVDHAIPSVNGANNERVSGEYEFEILRRTQLALLRSNFVLTSALRNPRVGSLPIIQRHTDPVEWLQNK